VNEIGKRKEDHLELCATANVAFPDCTPLWNAVTLVHDALPEMALDDVSLDCTVLGKPLKAPIIISAMTGGTARAGVINRDLAAVAEELGLGFALGSQRPMLEDDSLTATYDVRGQAPSTLLLGNLGLCQARVAGPARIDEIVRRVGADALAIHLNPAQELIQPGGDRDFRQGIRTLAALRDHLSVPLMVKETGCGIGLAAARKLRQAGVDHVDVAGAGGTSWVAVEAHRAPEADQNYAKTLANWGVPSAAAVGLLAQEGFATLIASGGITNGLDAARALALGADAVGLARPLLQAYWRGGADTVRQQLQTMIHTLRAVMLLTGSGDLAALRRAPRAVAPPLSTWLAQG
jgi:isopentenyl-diphosphate delta-isomerase